MPTYRANAPFHPWHARAKRDGLEWSLGYHATKEEAIAAEEEFAKLIPSRRHGPYRDPLVRRTPKLRNHAEHYARRSARARALGYRNYSHQKRVEKTG